MSPDNYYHVYTHANGFENLFQCDDNYRYFLDRYKKHIPSVADTLAWCLMPNHIHFFVRVKPTAGLAQYFGDKHPEKTKALEAIQKQTALGQKTLDEFTVQQFSHLLNGYTQAFNKMYQRRGSLFRHTFKRKEVTSDSYFTALIRYIHTNPVHHGFVSTVDSWPWSSYREILCQKPFLVNSQEVIDWFGGIQEFYSLSQPAVNPAWI